MPLCETDAGSSGPTLDRRSTGVGQRSRRFHPRFAWSQPDPHHPSRRPGACALVVIGMAFAASAAVPTGRTKTPFTAGVGGLRWRLAEGIVRAAFAGGGAPDIPVELAGV